MLFVSPVAHLVEQPSYERWVVGSIPTRTIFIGFSAQHVKMNKKEAPQSPFSQPPQATPENHLHRKKLYNSQV